MPTFPTSYGPWQTEAIVGIETTPGTAATTGLIREECRSIDIAQQFTTETETGYFGVAADVTDETLTQRYANTSLQVSYRNAGLGAVGLLTMCGSGTEVITGASSPYSHTGTPSPTNVREDTWSIWENTGDSTHLKQSLYATLQSIGLTSGPSGAVVADMAFTGRFSLPLVTRPTVNTYIGSTTNYPKTRQQGNAMQVTLYNSAGSPITATVTNLNLTLKRPVSMVPNPNGLDPIDFVPGILASSGSLTFRYDGSGAGTLMNDYHNHNRLGDASHVHQVVWTDADGNTTTIKFFGIYLSNGQLQRGSDTYVTGTVDFTAFNDLATINSATPSLSVIQSVVITNAIPSTMS